MNYKKPPPSDSKSLLPKDMHKFWTVEQKRKFVAFKNQTIVSERVINLQQLEETQCSLSTYFKSHKLYLFLHICGLEVLEEHVYLIQNSMFQKIVVN